MRRIIPLIVLALVAPSVLVAAICGPPSLLKASAQESSTARPRPGPPAQSFEPLLGPLPVPPPHVVVMRSDQGDRRVLHRDGWMRTESAAHGVSSVHMSGPGGYNYATGISADGMPVSVWLSRSQVEAPSGRRTEMTDTVLGERCEVWATEPTVQERVYGGPFLRCITSDGVTLWVGRGPPGAETPRIDVRAVSLERRTPTGAEFYFPREALDWSYWSSQIALPPERARPAYEIRFGEHVLRVRGDYRYEGGAENFSIRSSGMNIHYAAPGGEAARLSIDLRPRQPYPHPLTGGSEPLDREPLRISGETCRWHRVDLDVRWGIVAVCVTADGIRFGETTEYDDDALEDRRAVATYFRRGAPAAELMLPPPTVFDPWIAALPE